MLAALLFLFCCGLLHIVKRLHGGNFGCQCGRLPAANVNRNQRKGNRHQKNHWVYGRNHSHIICQYIHDKGEQQTANRPSQQQTQRNTHKRQLNCFFINDFSDLSCGSSQRFQHPVEPNILCNRNVKHIVDQQITCNKNNRNSCYKGKHGGKADGCRPVSLIDAYSFIQTIL